MKKLPGMLAALFMAGAGASSYAQTTQTTAYTPEEYQRLKASGDLPAGNFIISLPAPVEDTPYEPAPASRDRASECACYVEPDVTYSLALNPTDDGSSSLINLPFSFCFYGANYSSLYINNNGNVSFVNPYSTYSASAFPTSSFIMVAPFWADVDTRGGNGQVRYKVTPTAIYVNWVNVGYYDTHGDKRNTFQLILTDGTDPIIGVGNNVAFCYKQMRWTTGDASSGSNGFGGTPATVGANRGNGTDFIQFGRFDRSGSSYTGPFGNPASGVGWLENGSFTFSTCVSGANIAPIVANVFPNSSSGNGSSCGDTLRICAEGDELYFGASFIAPEQGQTISIAASAPTLSNFNIVNSANGSITMHVEATPADAGYHVVTVDATDDGTPALTTTLNFVIYVDTNGLSNFNPVITGPSAICGSNAAVLDAGAGYDLYYWSTGETTQTYSANAGGTYYVTVELNGCLKSVSHDLEVHPLPTPAILGTNTYCAADSYTILTGSPGYVSYVWTVNGVTVGTSQTINASAGLYTLTVTDANGCQGTVSRVVSISPGASVNITGNTFLCSGESTVLTANAYGASNFLWSTGETTASIVVTTSGTYICTVSSAGASCTASDTLVVVVSNPLADFSMSPASPVDINTTIQFTDQSGTGSSDPILTWNWNFGDSIPSVSSAQNPTHQYDTPGDYWVTLVVSTGYGCRDTLTRLIRVRVPVTVPNVFSPGNADGINDVFYVESLEYYPNTRLEVVNRWGQTVYKSDNYQNDWNGKSEGKLLSGGTYYYVLTFHDGDVKTGSVTIFAER